jgi:hypothetical protein
MSNIMNYSYFLEIGPTDQPASRRSLAKGICIRKNESTAEKTHNIWGQLSFYDQIENRSRIISIQEPSLNNHHTITCLSDINDRYHFTRITKENWSEVLKFIKLPIDVEKVLQAEVKTDEQIQQFFFNYF